MEMITVKTLDRLEAAYTLRNAQLDKVGTIHYRVNSGVQLSVPAELAERWIALQIAERVEV